jgi:putative nucleotidyltransferase with HDIG domain
VSQPDASPDAAPEAPPTPLERALAALRSDPVRRGILLVLLALGTALLVVDYVSVPTRSWAVGDVADRDIRATSSFEFVDWNETYRQQRAAQEQVLPVFDFDATLAARLNGRVSEAFEQARRDYAEALLAARSEEREDLTEAELATIAMGFLEQLELALDAVDVERIVEARWSRDIEQQVVDLVAMAMRSYIVADKSVLPSGARAIHVVRILSADDRDEIRLDGFDGIVVPSVARRQISLYALENGDANDAALRAGVAVARAAVRPNFSYNQLITENRRREARDAVSDVVVRVPRGTVIVREGDRVDARGVELIAALQASRTSYGLFGVLLALIAVSGLVYIALFQFATGYIKKFARETRQLEAVAVLVLLALGIGRLAVELSVPLASGLGLGISPSSFWYLVPYAGCAMLARILVNSETAIVFVLASAMLMGVMMDQEVLFTLFFAVSGVTAAGALAHIRERVGVLRAGLLTGLVNAAAALLLNLVRVYMGDSPVLVEATTQPLWDVGFAFLGGLLSGVLVLGLVPVFELFGFVTDYKLLELANLNHPLLRQLMLRAPGTYHHSVTVAQLCEAAAERIGANALQTRVACYFHDIGKAVNPKYFIENQRGGPNPHDRLPPLTSARIIINHVEDGEAIARQYNLPQPIIDGVTMHHGTGLIQYFYAKAVKEAGPDEEVDEADFRYRGSPPQSRETGIMMLADKVEAACRTLKDKSPENIRALIQKLVNGAILDGQLEQCPLTVKELYLIVDSFTETLLGIYHHRIEYPGIPQRRAAARHEDPPSGPIITLETANPLSREKAAKQKERAAERESGEVATAPQEHVVEEPPAPVQLAPRVSPEDDYESADHAEPPRGGRVGVDES